MNISSRIDVLLYAHDGRGLGHVSRSIAIGLSIRRLFPELKIALITGSPYAQMLTNQLPLEIIKLPSYNVKVQNGESYGAKNNINSATYEALTRRPTKMDAKANTDMLVKQHTILNENQAMVPTEMVTGVSTSATLPELQRFKRKRKLNIPDAMVTDNEIKILQQMYRYGVKKK